MHWAWSMFVREKIASSARDDGFWATHLFNNLVNICFHAMFSMYCYCYVSVQDQVLKSAYEPLQKKMILSSKGLGDCLWIQLNSTSFDLVFLYKPFNRVPIFLCSIEFERYILLQQDIYLCQCSSNLAIFMQLYVHLFGYSSLE